MKIDGIETFIVGALAGALIAAFVIYMRKRRRKPRRIPHTPIFRQSAPTFQVTKLKVVSQRRKIEVAPNITAFFPVHPIVRPEAPLL